MRKDEIRRQVKASKCLLSEQEKALAADNVFRRLEQTMAFIMAEKILIYHSLPDELSTISFIDKWDSRKTFYLPRVNGDDLDILRYDKTKLKTGSFNIEEPLGDNTVNLNEIDLVIVPAIAYDHLGNRVGRGKGYYDRLLSECATMKIGICYDFQLIEEIDTEPHDVKVDIIITDRRLVKAYL